MKRYIKTISGLLILLSFSGFAYAQNSKVISKTGNPTDFKSDSTELKSLVVKLLKWHESDKKSDFEPLTGDSKDTVYTGINWQLHKTRMAELEKTNFFAKDFLDNYQNIALHVDKELKENKTKYLVGDLPPYGDETNEWCNCQDYPGNIWKHLKIVNLKITDNSATFKWTWGDNFFYSIKASKENNVWKIAELEKFTIKNFSW